MNGNTTSQPTKRTKYVVMDEHTLGYLMDDIPNYMGVLAGSVLCGGRNPLDGNAILTPGSTRLRPATEIDFDFFRRVVPPDFEWEGGACERDRWDAGQQVFNRYAWPSDLEIIGRRGWNLVSRQHLQCFVDVCRLGSRETSGEDDHLKLEFHVEFDQGGAVSEAYALDMNRKLAGYRGDVDLGPTVWTTDYEGAAASEGWLISHCNDLKRLQQIDDPGAYRKTKGFLPPALESDAAAFRIVANGKEPHHVAIRAILKAKNPGEYAAMMAYKMCQVPATASSIQ